MRRRKEKIRTTSRYDLGMGRAVMRAEMLLLCDSSEL